MRISDWSSDVCSSDLFYIPKAYGSSIALSGGAEIALWSFFAFYLSCAVLTRVVYSGPRAAPRRPGSEPPAPSAVPVCSQEYQMSHFLDRPPTLRIHRDKFSNGHALTPHHPPTWAEASRKPNP